MENHCKKIAKILLICAMMICALTSFAVAYEPVDACAHKATSAKYFKTDSSHQKKVTCNSCGAVISWGDWEKCNFAFNPKYEQIESSSQHKKTLSCKCGKKQVSYEAHDGNNECVCGYEKVVEHVHEYELSSDYSLNHNTAYHWQMYKCSCGASKSDDKGEHAFVGGKCVICGQEQPHTHNYSTFVKTEHDPNGHWDIYKCSCGETTTKNDAAHEFSGTICVVCEYIHEHNWKLQKDRGYNETHCWDVYKCDCGAMQEKNKGKHDITGKICIYCGQENKNLICSATNKLSGHKWNTTSYQVNPAELREEKHKIFEVVYCESCDVKISEKLIGYHKTREVFKESDEKRHEYEWFCLEGCGLIGGNGGEHVFDKNNKCTKCGYDKSLCSATHQNSGHIATKKEESNEDGTHDIYAYCEECDSSWMVSRNIKCKFTSKTETYFNENEHWTVKYCICGFGEVQENTKKPHQLASDGKCKGCNFEGEVCKNHTYALVITKEPTCTEFGEYEYRCTKCGKIEEASESGGKGGTIINDSSQSVSPKGHKFNYENKKCTDEVKCERCGAVSKSKTYGHDTKCTRREEKTHTFTCLLCGFEITSEHTIGDDNKCKFCDWSTDAKNDPALEGVSGDELPEVLPPEEPAFEICKHKGKTRTEIVYKNLENHIIKTICEDCNEVKESKESKHNEEVTEWVNISDAQHTKIMYCKDCNKYYPVTEAHSFDKKGLCKCGVFGTPKKEDGKDQNTPPEIKLEKIEFDNGKSKNKNEFTIEIGAILKLSEYLKLTPKNAKVNLKYVIIEGEDGVIILEPYTGKLEAKKASEALIRVKVEDSISGLSAEAIIKIKETKGDDASGDKEDDAIQEPDQNQEQPKETTKFDDVADDAWYKEDVDKAVENNLFNGTSENTFSPNNAITRGMFVTVLARLDNADVKNFANMFEDVETGKYYQESISWAVAYGIVNGVGEGKFAPDNQITREAMAVIIYNYIKSSHRGLLEEVDQAQLKEEFTDQNEIAGWAKDAVMNLKALGLINGKSGGNYKPKDTVTRAEGAVILQRLFDRIKTSEASK